MNLTTTISRSVVARIQATLARERGASMVEYALLISMIALVAFIAVAAFGDALGTKNTGIAGSINGAIDNRG
jgi:Flp pilus assembly pilin Flp